MTTTFDLKIQPVQPATLSQFGPMDTPGTRLNQLLFSVAPMSTGLVIDGTTGVPVSMAAQLYAVYQALTGPTTTGNLIEIQNVNSQTFLVVYSGCSGSITLSITGTIQNTMTPKIGSNFTPLPPLYSGPISFSVTIQ